MLELKNISFEVTDGGRQVDIIQNLDLTGYDFHSSKQLSGTTDTDTAATAKPIP